VAEWVFWAVAAVAVTACLGVVFAPLLRGGGVARRRASYDMQVHRDRLRAVEADVACGVLSEAEAEATRIEISRRLLAAAAAEGSEAAARAAPEEVTRLAAPAMIVAALLAAGGLYALLGAPGTPDQPLAERQARAAAARADRPGQAEAEALAAEAGQAAAPSEASAEDLALVARLQAALATRPDDLEGHRLLARSLAGLSRWAEARAAQERVVAILGDAAAAADHVDLAEMAILAAGGYVSPEAEAALARGLALDPGDPGGRYYSALALMQGGRPDLAWRIWSRLVAEGPPDAPWIAAAEAGAAEAARLAGLPPAGDAGPTAADIAAAEAMAPAERQAMIAGMVDGLAGRLAAEGGPPEDWARLIRSLGVLGRREEAQAILAEARAKHRGSAEGLAAIEAAARDAGLAP
jgi:cytochrome c-type biogenesis protein CcmH